MQSARTFNCQARGALWTIPLKTRSPKAKSRRSKESRPALQDDVLELGLAPASQLSENVAKIRRGEGSAAEGRVQGVPVRPA